MTRIGIYNENVHEQTKEEVRAIYPEGIHGTLASFLKDDDVSIRIFTLDTVEEITAEALDEIDVLLWWGHAAHNKVPDEIAFRVRDAVQKGMGIIFLHSGHHSKPFRFLMGTSCNLNWREDGDMERIWVVKPSHPIAKGLGRYFELPHDETYGEPFCIPDPDDVVFITW